MKVAMVSEHASPLAVLGGVDAGGQNVHVAALARAIAQEGHVVVVYTRRDDPDLPRRVAFAPNVVVEHIDAGPPRFVSKDELFAYMDEFADELRRAWKRWNPDVIHSHFWMSGYAALRATAGLGIPVGHTFHALGCVRRRHQGAKDKSPPERDDVEPQIVRFADRLIATCSDEIFELRRLGADHERISLVPCGVDLDLFTPKGPAERRRAGYRRIVVVSRLVERKGIDNAIEALAHVPQTELIVAGGPPRLELHRDPEARRLMAIADRAGVRDRVVFRGRVSREQVPCLLRSADALVSTPWYEPFGIAPVEAMACGLPVVAAAVGGMIDTVVDGVTGVHVPPRDPAALAEALNRLLADPEKRSALGEAGYRRARSRFGWARIASLTLAAYNAMLRGRLRASTGAR